MSTERHTLRAQFSAAWNLHLQGAPLSAQQSYIVEVLRLYPEYQESIAKGTTDADFALDENPYMRMGLHLAVKDQIRTNRPEGIARLAAQATAKMSLFEVEQALMGVLAQMFSVASRDGEYPPEEYYLSMVRSALHL